MELLEPDLELTLQSNSKMVIHGQVSFDPIDDSVLKHRFLHRHWQEVAGADILASPTEYVQMLCLLWEVHLSQFDVQLGGQNLQLPDQRFTY